MIKSLHSATVHSRNVSCTEDGWFTLCMKNAFRGCVFVCVCAHAPDLRLCVRFLLQKLFFFFFRFVLSFRTWFCLFNLCLQFWFLMWGTKDVVTNRLLRCTLACLLRLLVETRAFTTYFLLETEIVRKAWQTSDGVRRNVCRWTTMIARHWWSSQQEEEEE